MTKPDPIETTRRAIPVISAIVSLVTAIAAACRRDPERVRARRELREERRAARTERRGG